MSIVLKNVDGFQFDCATNERKTVLSLLVGRYELVMLLVYTTQFQIFCEAEFSERR